MLELYHLVPRFVLSTCCCRVEMTPMFRAPIIIVKRTEGFQSTRSAHLDLTLRYARHL